MRHNLKAAAVVAFMLVVGLASLVAAGPLDDLTAAINRGDYATALRLVRPLGDQGNAGAQRVLGAMYASGRGVTKDYVEAARWFRKTADQGDSHMAV